MILRMAAPWKDPKTGVLYLHHRTPKDLVSRLKGRKVSLPMGGGLQEIAIGNIVPVTGAHRALVVAKVASIMDAAWGGLQPRESHSAPATAPLSEHEANRIVERPSTAGGSHAGGTISVSELFDRWSTYHKDKVAESTIRRYSASLASLAAYFGNRDVRAITGDDLYARAEHRRDQEQIKPRVINRNDLVAVSSVLG
jgi:Phage integrase, N-terminal SAM-like domain